MLTIFRCFAIVVFLVGQYGQANIPAYDIQLKDLLKMQIGLGWPSEMLVAEGQEALMKLTSKLPNAQSCVVTTPSGEKFDVTSPPDSRYASWSDGCGLRVRNVKPSDRGRWRLTSSRGQDSITGWIEVTVQEDIPSYTAPPISLLDGQTHTDVDLTSLNNSYCLVAQPFSESSLVPGHCRVTLEKTTRAVQGNWNILIGIPGRVSEIQLERHVAVEAERLDVGYIHDSSTNKIHLYCNILHTSKNITFCRFQMTTNTLGFNVMEGLSDGIHSYYGNGFVAKQCGMTIESPTSRDYGTWRCSVGSQQWVGNTLQQQTPMQALINVIQNQKRARVEQESNVVKEDRTVFVQESLSFTVLCRAEVSLSYCWFLHPNGTQFSPVPRSSEEQLFWYSGESLQTGDCGITFVNAHKEDAGDWICHMGATNQLGVEITDRVNVRVTGPLAANKKEIDVEVGQNATLFCHTANGNRPLDYCRFLSPNFVGINIDASITKENAILGRYYFTPERQLDYGDCSITIIAVEPEDIGLWTCAALINNDNMESSDTINLVSTTSGGIPRAPLSQAGIAGMSIGILGLLSLLAGVVWYKIGKPVPWRTSRDTQSTGQVPFDLMSMNTRSVGRSSMGNNSLENMSDRSESGSEPRSSVSSGPTVDLNSSSNLGHPLSR